MKVRVNAHHLKSLFDSLNDAAKILEQQPDEFPHERRALGHLNDARLQCAEMLRAAGVVIAGSDAPNPTPVRGGLE